MMDKVKMRKLVQDVIEEADIDFRCNGTKTEYDDALELEYWNLQDPDAVVNNIMGVFSEYLEWCLE